MSDEHADTFVWEEEAPQPVVQERRGGSRRYVVEEIQNQNEDVVISQGFTVRI